MANSSTATKVINMGKYLVEYFDQVRSSLVLGFPVSFFSNQSISRNNLEEDARLTAGAQSTHSEAGIHGEMFFYSSLERETTMRQMNRNAIRGLSAQALNSEVSRLDSEATLKGQIIDTKTPAQRGKLS